MKLVIVDNEGEVHEVLTELELYDLDRGGARAEVIIQIQDVLETLRLRDEAMEKGD